MSLSACPLILVCVLCVGGGLGLWPSLQKSSPLYHLLSPVATLSFPWSPGGRLLFREPGRTCTGMGLWGKVDLHCLYEALCYNGSERPGGEAPAFVTTPSPERVSTQGVFG